MQLQFIGAARTVTGSMHYLQINGKKILLDCGLYQGKRKESFELNRSFDFFNPNEIDYVVLSHAHIDHIGNLPSLVKHGFNGIVYSTFATRDLASLMLRDSAHIQERDVEFVNKKRKRQGKNLFEPLYTLSDVEKTDDLFAALNYHRDFQIADGIKLTFFDAGHILGSAIILLTINEKGRIIKFGFSGDLGRPNLPILKSPEKISDVDFFVCESTYGGRFHDKIEEAEAKLAEVIKKAHDRKGKIIVPAFSVGRTQELVYSIHKIFKNKSAPKIPIFVDSPLSTNATEIFRLHPECFNFDISKFLINHEDPFGFNQLTYIRDAEDSKKLNEIPGPYMIISASGMAETGRILHHLKNSIEDPKNMVLIVGYCAENTLGKKIVEKEKIVRILGDKYKLNAEVVVMNSYSAHADSNELSNYCDKLDKSRMQKLFLVHGDFDQQEKFGSKLKSLGFNDVLIPQRGEIFEL